MAHGSKTKNKMKSAITSGIYSSSIKCADIVNALYTEQCCNKIMGRFQVATLCVLFLLVIFFNIS